MDSNQTSDVPVKWSPSRGGRPPKATTPSDDPREMVGKTFGLWTVKEPAEPSDSGAPRWWCICRCGERRRVHDNSLTSHMSVGCGTCPDFVAYSTLDPEDERGIAMCILKHESRSAIARRFDVPWKAVVRIEQEVRQRQKIRLEEEKKAKVTSLRMGIAAAPVVGTPARAQRTGHQDHITSSTFKPLFTPEQDVEMARALAAGTTEEELMARFGAERRAVARACKRGARMLGVQASAPSKDTAETESATDGV